MLRPRAGAAVAIETNRTANGGDRLKIAGVSTHNLPHFYALGENQQGLSMMPEHCRFARSVILLLGACYALIVCTYRDHHFSESPAL
jgi:hypothetical protein